MFGLEITFSLNKLGLKVRPTKPLQQIGSVNETGLPLVSDPVCVVHGRELEVGRVSSLGTSGSHLWFCWCLQTMTSECEAAGMGVSSSKSRVRALNRG